MNTKSIIALGNSIEGDNWLRIDGISNKVYKELKKKSDRILGNENMTYPESYSLRLAEPIELHINGILYKFSSLMNFNYPNYDLEDYDLRVNFYGSDSAIKLKSENLKFTKNKTNKKDGLEMMNLNNNLGFDKVEGLVGISMLDGKVAYNLNGKWISLGLDNSLVDVSGFAKELDVDSMILPMAVNQVQVGDLIIIEDQPVLVIGNQNGEIKTTNGDGEIKSVVPTVNQLYGAAIVKKVFNPLINGAMGGANGMMGGQMNPMMLMALSGNMGGGDSSMMETMLMMNMFQNNGGMMGMGTNNQQQHMNMQQQPMTANPNYNMNQPQPNVNFAEQQVQGWSQPINQEQQQPMQVNPIPQQPQQSVNDFQTEQSTQGWAQSINTNNQQMMKQQPSTNENQQQDLNNNNNQ